MLCNAQRGIQPVIYNLAELVMLYQLRKDVNEETFVPYIEKCPETHAATDGFPKTFLAFTPLMAQIEILLGFRTDTAIKEKQYIIAYATKEPIENVLKFNDG